MTIPCVTSRFLPSKQFIGLGFLLVSGPLAFAQCSQQPAAGTTVLPPGGAVYYQLDSSINNLPQQGGSTPSPATQIGTAINNWNSASQQQGNYSVLLPATAANPASVTFTVSQTPLPGTTQYDQAVTAVAAGIVGPSNPATITFFPQSISNGYNASAYQAIAAGYGTMYTNVAAHEIAHISGIGDYTASNMPNPPTTGSSVVSPTRGPNDINDAAQKLGPTPCDMQQVLTSAAAVAGSSGGSGGGAPPHGNLPTQPCQDVSTVDFDSGAKPQFSRPPSNPCD